LVKKLNNCETTGSASETIRRLKICPINHRKTDRIHQKLF